MKRHDARSRHNRLRYSWPVAAVLVGTEKLRPVRDRETVRLLVNGGRVPRIVVEWSAN